MYEVWFGREQRNFNDFFAVVRAIVWYEYPSEVRVFNTTNGKEITSLLMAAVDSL